MLSRWDQAWRKPWKTTEDTALDELIVLGVRAAVVTHEDEVRTFAASDPVVTSGTADIEIGKTLAGFVRPR